MMMFTEHSFRQVYFQPPSTQIDDSKYLLRQTDQNTNLDYCQLCLGLMIGFGRSLVILRGQHHMHSTDESLRSQNARFPEPCTAPNRMDLAVTAQG